ncbi:unnamed protein product [Acanthosepion pharaonis]|uniref:Reverse transcriptase domain-containing protein n=1 Tax=Acanthosepion pharaonis TaxID=158019 RepID=A0A812EKU2_ACAPH|nr:unnamed protein product [Sepia pharaonis]
MNRPLSSIAASIDVTKAFDTVNRRGMWQIIGRLGCSPKFLNMIIQIHEDQGGQVRHIVDFSESFSITNSVKQGCVLAATRFIFFFSMMIKQAMEDADDEDGVYIRYSFDGGLFNLRRLKSPDKDQLIRELCFDDDSALVAHTEGDLPRTTSCFTEAAKFWGLKSF